jgi:histidinol dehydrogenase
MLAQAEHDEAAAVLLLVDNADYAEAIVAAIPQVLADNPRRDIATASLEQNGLVVVCDDLQQAIGLSNRFAPEHLQLCVAKPEDLLPELANVGAIFVGAHTPEAIGDYLAGPSHVLPTQGTARFFSPLGVEDFLKRTSVMAFSAEALRKYGNQAATLADHEGLHAHAQSIRLRLKP